MIFKSPTNKMDTSNDFSKLLFCFTKQQLRNPDVAEKEIGTQKNPVCINGANNIL